jgi:hypothetical protein
MKSLSFLFALTLAFLLTGVEASAQSTNCQPKDCCADCCIPACKVSTAGAEGQAAAIPAFLKVENPAPAACAQPASQANAQTVAGTQQKKDGECCFPGCCSSAKKTGAKAKKQKNAKQPDC